MLSEVELVGRVIRHGVWDYNVIVPVHHEELEDDSTIIELAIELAPPVSEWNVR